MDDEVSSSTEGFVCDPEQVYFIGCSFVDDGMGILRECPSVDNIGFIRCNLSYDELENLLHSNNPYNHIEFLDLTKNKLAEDPDLCVDLLKFSFFHLRQ